MAGVPMERGAGVARGRGQEAPASAAHARHRAPPASAARARMYSTAERNVSTLLNFLLAPPCVHVLPQRLEPQVHQLHAVALAAHCAAPRPPLHCRGPSRPAGGGGCSAAALGTPVAGERRGSPGHQAPRGAGRGGAAVIASASTRPALPRVSVRRKRWRGKEPRVEKADQVSATIGHCACYAEDSGAPGGPRSGTARRRRPGEGRQCAPRSVGARDSRVPSIHRQVFPERRRRRVFKYI